MGGSGRVPGSSRTWGTGWTFFPDVYPSGEEIFGTSSATNAGGYADFVRRRQYRLDARPRPRASAPYADYLAQHLPVIFEPVPAASLTEIKDDLEGVTPQNVFGAITPENWRQER